MREMGIAAIDPVRIQQAEPEAGSVSVLTASRQARTLITSGGSI